MIWIEQLVSMCEGKTYPVIESLKPFPKDDVWLIGSMYICLVRRGNLEWQVIRMLSIMCYLFYL
jgi:hypothetical protein